MLYKFCGQISMIRDFPVIQVVAKSCPYSCFNEGLQQLLRIGSAHNIGGLHDLEIAQISHVFNFFEHKLCLLLI